MPPLLQHTALLAAIAGLVGPGFPSNSAWGANASPRQQVRTGLEQHRAGEYGAAAESFAAAEKALPDEPRITYDRACALAAQGKREEATELFQQAALAREPKLAAASHYNLGCLVARQAQELFGEHPEQAEAATREQGVKLLHQAVMHYRDCLRIDHNHERARKNLELLRLWIKHMEDVWARRDREQRREEMNLLEFLQWIQGEQRALQAAVKALGQVDGSPRQRQAITVTENSQRLLADEIDPLQEKLNAAVAEGQPAEATDVQAARALNQLAQQAKSAMFRAADDLVVRELSSALTAQDDATNALNDIYCAIAPYEHLLRQATDSQQTLVNTSVAILEEDADESLVDRELAARDQRYIAGWSELLPARAEQGLAQLAAGGGTPPGIGPPTDEQLQKQQQAAAALKASYEKAIELAPQIVDLAEKAADSLDAGKWQEARPRQEEALRLLREIAPQTPPDDNQQDDQQKDQQDQQDDKQDQQPQGNEEQQQEQPDQSQPDQPSDNKQQQEQQKQELSRQQAEALLSKARQREREHRERQKQQMRALQGTYRVERDW